MAQVKIESVDDLRRALGVESLREMSGEKVLELAKMWQNDELSGAVQAALLRLAPQTFHDMTASMDSSLNEAVKSNDASSANYYAAAAQTKEILKGLLEDPSTSEEMKKSILEQIRELDNLAFEHDVNNKRFGLQALQLKKETLMTIGVGAAALVVSLAPGGRKLLTEGAKMLALGKK